MNVSILTRTEKGIWDALSDGEIHAKAELMLLLPDELGDEGNLRLHVHNLRKKIAPYRLDIVHTNGSSPGDKKGYRLMRQIDTSDE